MQLYPVRFSLRILSCRFLETKLLLVVLLYISRYFEGKNFTFEFVFVLRKLNSTFKKEKENLNWEYHTNVFFLFKFSLIRRVRVTTTVQIKS